jgi:hypothetical protein
MNGDMMLRLNKIIALRILLILATAILLANTIALSRDYQDSWILEGLGIPFAFFVVIFVLAFFFEKKASSWVVLAVLGRVVLLLVPNLKYVWFQGTAIDQFNQYFLANQVYVTGHISSAISLVYPSTPLLHLLFSIFSIVLKVQVEDSMKYLPVLFSSIYPLLTYLIVKRIRFLDGTAIKCVLFISSFPLAMEEYLVTGSMFGTLLALLILVTIVIILEKNDRRLWIIWTILAFALVTAHSVTSTILVALLLGVVVLERIRFFHLKPRLRPSIAITFAVISLAWLLFYAGVALNAIALQLYRAAFGGPTPPSESLPPTFWGLAQTDVFAAAKTFILYFGADAVFLVVSLVGLAIVIVRRPKLDGSSKFLFLVGGLILMIIPMGVLIRVGAARDLHFARLLYPVFFGIVIFYLGRIRSWIRPILLLFLVILAIVELYGCQPLMPSASILYSDVPEGVPLGNMNQVNTIYQRQVCIFASDFVVGRIACDSETENQILGLAGYNYSQSHIIGYYPLDKTELPQEYDFFIIHIPGKGGTLGESADIRTPSQILDIVSNSTIIYTNGESFVLANSISSP